jgi:membrane protease subunit HflC
MTRLVLPVVVIGTLVALLVLVFCAYTIDPTEQAIVLYFGKPEGVVTEPGLHAVLPGYNVIKIDRRLLNLDAPSEEVIAQDKKRIVVDAFARWRIIDALQYYKTFPNRNEADSKLAPILSSSIRRVLGSQNFAAMLSARRAELMHDIRDDLNQETKGFGIHFVDVRIRRADLPSENSEAIYNRMKKEREREANEYRAEGDETAQRIRARAEREVTVIEAEATREGQVVRGEGDAEKTRLLGDAYGQDPDFFAFYRSMRAYQEALQGENTTVVLSPNSEFFHYFGHGAPGSGPVRKK